MKKLVVLFLLLSSAVFAQELNCNVTVSVEGLPVVNRDILSGFANTVETYMNKTKFTSDEWDGDKINCSLNIYFTGASSETNYSAQVVIVSQRPIYKSQLDSPVLTINDGQWSFTYQKNQPLVFNQSIFDPLTSFLDYYAYIIIGMDLDTWQPLGGTPFFSKAYDIVNMGANSSFSQGWSKSSGSYSRYGLVDNLLNDKYRAFREAIADYYLGIDYYTTNKKAAQQKMVKLINTLDAMRNKVDINSTLIKVFFDAKSGEIVERLKDYPDKNIFSMLKKIDPPHSAKYDQVLDGKI